MPKPIAERYKEAVIARMEERSDRDAILDTEKVKSMRTRRMQNELILAKARDEVILKSVVEKQAAYLLVSLRQKILSVPQAYARRFVGLTDVNQASRLLKDMAVSVLNEIRNLPQQITDPHWIEKLDE
jgi:hypothetical protein